MAIKKEKNNTNCIRDPEKKGKQGIMSSTIKENHQGEEVEVVPASDRIGTPYDESTSVDSNGKGSNTSSNEHSEYKRDPFFAFVPQIAQWGCGILTNEAKTVQKGIMAAPGFTKDFLFDTYTFYRAKPRIL